MIINKISLKYRRCEAVLEYYDDTFVQANIELKDREKRILCALNNSPDELMIIPNGEMYVAMFVYKGELLTSYLHFRVIDYEGKEEKLVKKVIDFLLNEECDLR